MSDDPTGLTLVTGASGFVGNNLVRHLLKIGRPVRALVYGEDESLRGLEVDRVVGDVRDPDTLRRVLLGVEFVYHLAAVISIDDDDRRMHLDAVNVEGTTNVVQACCDAKVRRLIHFSSIHAISYLPKNESIDESRSLALDPALHLPYDQSKANGERRVLEGVQRGLDAVVLNPVGIVGPYDFGPSATGDLLLRLAQRRFPGLAKGGYNWVDVRDVAAAAVAAERQGRSGHRYILTSEFATFQSIARWVEEVSGSQPPRLNLPIWLARAAAPLAVRISRLCGRRALFTPESIQIITCHQRIDTTKAREELGFHPRPVRESVRDATRWLLEQFAGDP